jgi:hypothetical protein
MAPQRLDAGRDEGPCEADMQPFEGLGNDVDKAFRSDHTGISSRQKTAKHLAPLVTGTADALEDKQIRPSGGRSPISGDRPNEEAEIFSEPSRFSSREVGTENWSR